VTSQGVSGAFVASPDLELTTRTLGLSQTHWRALQEAPLGNRASGAARGKASAA
jgi:hypothetical protein